MNLGAGIAIGVGAGTVLFAITGEELWLAIGPGFGTNIGLALGGTDDED